MSGGKAPGVKGAKFEVRVTNLLIEALPGVEVVRHGHAQRRAEREGRPIPPDVQAKAIAALEVKHHKTYPNIIRELETAAARRSEGEYPVGVVKGDRQPAVIAMFLDDWLELLGQWWKETRPPGRTISR